MTRPSPRPRDGIESAVFEVFEAVLARAPTAAECVEWSGKLLRGVPVRQLREALEAAPERNTLLEGRPVEGKPVGEKPVGEKPAEGRPVEAGPGAAAIGETGLFDAAWYRRRYPDVAEAGMDPLHHYAEHGWREGRAPNPYFDPPWYQAAHSVPPHENSLLHYLSLGEARDHPPSAKFDPGWYRATYGLPAGISPLADFLRRRHEGTVAPNAALWAALGSPPPPETGPADDVFLTAGEGMADLAALRGTGLFDENYYALHSGDVLTLGLDSLAHYCEFGWREQRQPNFYFDCRWYAATNPEVTRLGVNPLAHYLLVGEKTGRRPIVFFDPLWYRETHGLPPTQSALGHFLTHRRSGTVSPNPLFDPVWYAARKGEPIRPGRDPFARFLVAGLTEDFSPSAAFDLAAWRKTTRGRVSRHFRHLLDPGRDNPLVDYLSRQYR